mmetsp:Transcript_63420/g.151569  ORF Transcript_63420/g.151569 Transcript_63420/m.151569 type:complete len:277 (+) Transcript_63420:633-1463(+)
MVLARQLLDEVKSLVHTTGTAHELHQNRQGEVAWLHAGFLHLAEHSQALIHQAALGAAVQQGVVHDLVGDEASLLPHLLDQLEGRSEVASLAVALEHGAVRDDIGLDVGLLHVLDDCWNPIHAAASSTAVQEGIVSDDREINVALLHLLINRPDFGCVLLAREALQHRAVDHRIEDAFAMRILAKLLDQVPGSIWVPVGHHRLDHAANSDAGGLDVTASHLFPAPPHGIHVFGVAVGLDETAKGVRSVDLDVARHQLPELGVQQVGLADANTGLHH